MRTVRSRRAMSAVSVDAMEAAAYVVPTDGPESDGTFEWDRTTLVTVHLSGGGASGVGHVYADAAAARLCVEVLAAEVIGRDCFDIGACWGAMTRRVRNIGRPGIAAMAIAAVDIALWDLKANLLGISLVALLGAVRERVAVYGSGGFITYDDRRLREELAAWVGAGITRVKIKIGRDAASDRVRVATARDVIGPAASLFVDANGAYSRKEALRQAMRLEEHGVTWFEEPVSSDDLEGLRLLRDRAPAGMEIAAGEYGFDLPYFRRMLDAGAVDVLQVDATRCMGITGFLGAGALCAAYDIPLSAHTAPSLHAHLCCAVPAAVHVEFFHDHARIEAMLFDGAMRPEHGALRPDRTRPGLGLELKQQDAARYLAWAGAS